jgi:long-chain acyl-CoA synthetase
MKYKNLSDLFFKRAEKYGDKVLLRYQKRRNQAFEEISWTQANQIIKSIASGLQNLGLEKGAKVGILSISCHEWILSDLGILSAAAISVPLYHSLVGESLRYLLNHAEIEFIIVRDKIQLQKIREIWHEFPKLKYVIVMRDRGDLPTNDPRILTLDSLINIGKESIRRNPDQIKLLVDQINLDDIATIIYTSGTTGKPKGVILSHRNILVAALSFYQYVPLEDTWGALSFLPLAHVFERVTCEFYGIDQGVSITFCEKVEDLPNLLKSSNASYMCVVPRILEKIHERVMLKSKKLAFHKRFIFEQALKIGIKFAKEKFSKKFIDPVLRLQYRIAYISILSKIKDQIAPDFKFFVVGGAPFSKELLYFFTAIGISVIEGYGLTETTAPITVNPVWANKPGTVGLPFNHFEVKIGSDGEILCRGDAVFRGYYKDEEATKEVLKEGWFYTGDLGNIDEEGYIKITGRKKDLLITAGGKNVSPTQIEELLLKSKFINQVVVLGDQEKYLAALVVLDKGEVDLWLEESSLLGLEPENYFRSKELNLLIESEIYDLTHGLPRYEQIKAFHILPKELTIEGGELTPTLKIKRNVVREKYRDLIKPLFQKTKNTNPEQKA